jgi:DNA-binding SARP family transcriptional activator
VNLNRDRRQPATLPIDHGGDIDVAVRALRDVHDRALRSADAVLSVAVLTAERALAEVGEYRARIVGLDRELGEQRRLHRIADHRFIEIMKLVEQLASGPPERSRVEASVAQPVPNASEAGEVRLCFFGSFALLVGGERGGNLAATKAASVLRYLGAHRRVPVTRDVLIEAIWPGLPADEGRHRLHQAIYGLRTQLRDLAGGLVRVGNQAGAYRLESDLPITTDVEDFEAATTQGALHESAGRVDEALLELTRAEALYVGDFLSDAPLEEWVHDTRERLRLHYVLACNRLAELLLAANRPHDALGVCERVTICEPSNEEAVRTMMYCYTEIGQRSLALKAFSVCESWMGRELGVQPSVATVALYERILSSDSP